MIVRQEIPQDIKDIYALTERAFGQPQEAEIIDKLRDNCQELLSLVAVEDERIVGHILFSPVTIAGEDGVVEGMGLAPMAVLPKRQRQGVGTQLVRSGLEQLTERTCPFVVVLGHPEYYPRFGFEPASRFGIKCQWPGVPDEAFMILWLDTAMMNRVSGVATYRDEFNEAA